MHLVASENTIAKTRRESLHLGFNSIRHVNTAVEWNVAVDPERMLSGWSSSFIKQTLLRDEYKWLLRNFPLRHVGFRRCDFIHRAADMHRAGAAARFRFPRTVFTQRVIDFEKCR